MFDSLNTFLSIKNEDFLCSHSFERDSYIFHVCNYEWMISGNYRYYFYFNCKNTLFVDLIINFCLVIYMNNDYVVHVSFYEPVVLRGRNSDSCRLCLSSCLHCINKVSCFSVVSNWNIYFSRFLYWNCKLESQCDHYHWKYKCVIVCCFYLNYLNCLFKYLSTFFRYDSEYLNHLLIVHLCHIQCHLNLWIFLCFRLIYVWITLRISFIS